jgi:hypothetical protein
MRKIIRRIGERRAAIIFFVASNALVVPTCAALAALSPWKELLPYVFLGGVLLGGITYILHVKSRSRGDVLEHIPEAGLFRGIGSAPKGFLVDLLMSPARADDAMFSILGRYDYWVGKYGFWGARFVFHTQCVGTIVTFWIDWLLRRIKLLELLRRS